MGTDSSQHSTQQKTVAILGNNPVVCHAIAHLVRRKGYQTRVFDLGQDDPEFAEVDIALIANDVAYESWKTKPYSETVAVLKLVDTPEERTALEEESILWPCATKDLHSALERVTFTRPF